MRLHAPNLARRARAGGQRGMVLLIVLVVLALLLLAGAGAMRAVDSGNVISGNFSFQQAAMQSADRALTSAMDAATNAVVGGGGNNDVANRYFSTRQTTVDARGFPSTINWNNVSCVDPQGAAIVRTPPSLSRLARAGGIGPPAHWRSA